MDQQVFVPTRQDLEDIISRVVKQNINEAMPEAVEKATRRKWITTEEVMELLQCSRRHIQHLRDSGALPFVQHARIVRYNRDEVEAFLNNHKIEASR